MANLFSRRSKPRNKQRESRPAAGRGKHRRSPGTRPAFELLEGRRLLSAVTGLVLVNADTGKDIGPLTNGQAINLTNLPTTHLNVRADTTSDTRSVKFGYDAKSNYHVENALPYDIAGDNGWGNYNSWTPTTGAHTITATPYTRSGTSGKVGTAVKVSFTVTNSSTPAVTPTPTPTPTPAPTPTPTPTPAPGPSTTPTPPPVPPPIPTPVPVVAPAPSAVAPPISGTWNTVFADEFNTAPSPATWVNTLWGNTQSPGELQNYSPSAVSVSNGILSLTATNQPSGGMPYTSGQINTGGLAGYTKPGFAFTYGYAEARMKLPAGQGLWPAFWMLPAPDANGNYQDGQGEIDIMEAVGNAITRDEVHLHHLGTSGASYDTGVDLSQGFHTYGVDWEPDHLTFYFDGKAIYSITDATRIPNVAEYLILNLAIGDANSWPGAPDASTVFPASLQVDYVHVWQKVA